MIRVTTDGHEIEFDTEDERCRIKIALEELQPGAMTWESSPSPSQGIPGTIGSSRIPRELLERVVARVEWTRNVIGAADRFRDADAESVAARNPNSGKTDEEWADARARADAAAGDMWEAARKATP